MFVDNIHRLSSTIDNQRNEAVRRLRSALDLGQRTPNPELRLYDTFVLYIHTLFYVVITFTLIYIRTNECDLYFTNLNVQNALFARCISIGF